MFYIFFAEGFKELSEGYCLEEGYGDALFSPWPCTVDICNNLVPGFLIILTT